jgi:hypothetical protein
MNTFQTVFFVVLGFWVGLAALAVKITDFSRKIKNNHDCNIMQKMLNDLRLENDKLKAELELANHRTPYR